MIYYILSLWRLHRTLLLLHGVYVSYSMVVWVIGGTKKTYDWFTSWFQEPVPQIEDRQYKENTVEGEYQLISRLSQSSSG